MKNQLIQPTAASGRIDLRARRALLRGLTLAGVLCLLAVSAGASSALASPWWHLTSGARPTYLHSGAGKDEVQEIKVTATAKAEPAEPNDVVVIEPASLAEFKEGKISLSELKKTEFAYNATHVEAQAALEALYGVGNVEVSGGPAGKPASVTELEPYVVAFKGALSDQAVGVMVTGFSPGLGGLEGEATVNETTQGSPDGEVVAFAENLGDEPVDGSGTPVSIVDTLPEHVRAVGVVATQPLEGSINTIATVPCALESQSRVSCSLTGALPPYGQIEVRIAVDLEPGAVTGEENTVSVSGGQARAASLKRPLTFSGAATPFGVEDYELVNEAAGGASDTQAGSHPFQQTTTIDLNQEADANPLETVNHKPKVDAAGLAKDLSFKWPAGLIGNPTPVARCTIAQFLTVNGGSGDEDACPADTAVGVASVTVNEPFFIGFATFTVPLFNLEPLVGEPARFGFDIPEADAPVYIDPAIRTGSDYGITVNTDSVTETASFLSARVTVWGVPGAPEHASTRGWGCLYESSRIPKEARSACEPPRESRPAPFLSLPTSCTGASVSTVEGDSWEQAEPRRLEPLGSFLMPALDGCNQLPFSPELRVSPDGGQASKPSGLNVDVHVPQEGQLNAAGLAQSNIKDIKVTLPEGVTVNPAGADGLEACSEGLVGFTGINQEGVDQFSSKLPVPLEQGVNFCPNASKIGEVSIKTPLLPAGQALKGAVYLAAQNANPFGSLIAMYIVAEDPVSGALVKLPGDVSLNQGTGQIESSFENTPQLAFEDAEIHFYGGERAPLSTPAHCGTYTTLATFTPWSGGAPVSSQSSFQITSGPNGTVCPGAALPFTPTLTAGTTNNNAAAFSPLTTTITREDGQQNIQTVQLHMPAGLSGILSGVKLCPEAQANAGTCGPESKIGSTIVSVGLGGDPFTVTGGEVFLTEKVAGSPVDAPFGLSIVNPAVAGPFNLGKVVVRATIAVDPHTAQLTVTTGAIPHILDGIPLQIKHVNVTVERPGFTFNPTNCSPAAVTGTIGSVEGSSSPVQVPFQVTNCASLKFAPKFSVSTSGKTSKANGASLTAKLSYPTAAQGTQANITRVKVDLPKQLPSRLTTLQKACTNAQFEANPAACPSASKIGFAKVTTPLLPVPLEGPAIFVSHGGEAFPSLTMVLQGYGVTVDLVGTTFISKAGITSTTFKTVPDVPFNNFQLTLPQGKFSALAANGNLCTSKLAMPTEFLAQNGAKINESTKISVTGCGKVKALTRTQKLKAALKACHKRAKCRQAACEQQARRRYGVVKAKKRG
jgi:hypothetical protein